MTAVLTTRTLVLNADWRPVNVLPVFKAVMKVFSGRALFLDPESFQTYPWETWITNWDDAIRESKIAADRVVSLAGGHLVLPEIIVCTEYHGFGYKENMKRTPKFSRWNLILRDRSVCQFCRKKLPSNEITMDHVIPVSKSGKTNWQNVVIACVACNTKKSDKLPSEVGMKLIRQPRQPTAEDLRRTPADRIRMKLTTRPPKTWEQFLGKMVMNVELEQD